MFREKWPHLETVKKVNVSRPIEYFSQLCATFQLNRSSATCLRDSATGRHHYLISIMVEVNKVTALRVVIFLSFNNLFLIYYGNAPKSLGLICNKFLVQSPVR